MEAQQFTSQQYRLLMIAGLSMEQPKAHKTVFGLSIYDLCFGNTPTLDCTVKGWTVLLSPQIRQSLAQLHNSFEP